MAISKLNPIEGGIPKGNTDNRSVEFPSPAIGDVYYNGTLEILEIYNGTAWVAVSAPPATPSIATPTDASSSDAYSATGGKLSVVFTQGSGGGTPNQYNAYTTAGGYSGFSETSTVVISGLTPGTAYTVYGNAQNNFGTTVNTANAAAVTPTTLPQSPTIGTTTLSSGVPVVNWTLNSNGGKTISSITITPYLNGTTAGTAQTAATTSSTSHIFTGLTDGSSYTFKVKTTNANGESLESSASNSVTVDTEFSLNYLVVAGGGGGGGGYNCGGGGGAGGVRSTITATGGSGSLESAITIQKGTNYTVTVGAGGVGGTDTGSAGVDGNNGTNSIFSTITSTAGGGGGGRVAGKNGGSGGGGGTSNDNITKNGGTGLSNQGYDGGTGRHLPGYYEGAGGGGGASTAGTNSNNAIGGNGGNGRAISITGSSVIYGGGGAGSGNQAGSAGSGGGGAQNNSGYSNTGGGGGGGYPQGATGGNGGSGIVVLRWLTTEGTITIGAGLTGSTATDGSYKVTTLTAGSGNVSWS